jgi:kynurenine formamidase
MTEQQGRRFVELSHPIRAGMITYPGLPAPTITPYLTRSDSTARYAPGTEFAMDVISMIGNTGTYLDAPWHRFAEGADLAGLPLERLVDLPAAVLRIAGTPARRVDADLLASAGDVRGAAVLIHSGDDARFGTPEYAHDPAFLTRDGAQWLVEQGAALVGIDAVNIDDAGDGTRPAHTLLLQAGIPVVEHLTGLAQLPLRGARFTAAPPMVAEFGTFPVRAFAVLPA